MRPSDRLTAHRDRVLALAGEHGVRHVRVFGSVAQHTDHEGSDVDLLVDWPAGRSLLHLVGLQVELEAELGVKVDLCTERELHPLLRDRILAQARPL
jgi:uncharacterized protein